MATLNHFAYNIRNIAGAGQGNSDDNRLTISQIKFWIQGYRAEGLEQKTDFGKHIDPQLVQDLGIVPIEEVDKADPQCQCVTWGCSIKKVRLPKFVDWPETRSVVFIGKIDKQTPLWHTKSDVDKFRGATKFGNIMSRCYFIGNDVYFELNEDDKDMEYINVRGVFEDPTKVEYYNALGCDPICYNPKVDEYPLPMSMYEYVLKKILVNELGWTLQAANDEINNARQDNQKLG